MSRLQGVSDPAAPHHSASSPAASPPRCFTPWASCHSTPHILLLRDPGTCSSLFPERLLPSRLPVFPHITLSVGPFPTTLFKIAAPSMYTPARARVHRHMHTHALRHTFVILPLSLSHCIFSLSVFVPFPYMYKLPANSVYCLSLPTK